ncbi:hypothetical protein [Actinoallomurus iriomotensis]|nr:hypothetical protein [Actinoallomurus iriomotensis]
MDDVPEHSGSRRWECLIEFRSITQRTATHGSKMPDRLEHLRMEASRDNYTSMVQLAQALYENRVSPRGVLRQCFKVEFPEEFFVIAEADPDLRGWLIGWSPLLPWCLAIDLACGLSLEPEPFDDTERDIFARDPDLIPLVTCRMGPAFFVWGFAGWCLCYRLSELKAGRTTVYRTHSPYSNIDPGLDVAPDAVVRCGDSLMAALHQHYSDVLAGLEYERHASARQSGGGWTGDEEVEVAQSVLADIEELRRRGAERQKG